MCGIFGCVGRITKETVQECIDKLQHRGPDHTELKELDGVTIAHTRLAIIDVKDRSNQPMCDISKRYWIVYNGEIYNYSKIRKELQDLGYVFTTKSDTEVILYAFIEWGESFQNKCNGMWGLAIWDNEKKELFLSRDRFGIKPLYYYEYDGNFYFASEMKAFFPIMPKKEIDYRIFDRKNWFSYESTENCVIRSIRKIQAGNCARYINGKMNIYQWWNTLDNLINLPEAYEEQVELFRDLFFDACKIRMRSDVPIGTALSGGVDSSAVAGMIKHIEYMDNNYGSESLREVFVASMPGTILDETRYAEIVAEKLNLKLNKIVIHGDVMPDDLLKYMYMCEDPYITCPIPFIYTYRAIREQGIKVTIDGHGADELFGGYTFDLFSIGNEKNIDVDEKKEVLSIYNETIYPSDDLKYADFIKRSKNMKEENISKHLKWNELDELNKTLYNEVHYRTLPTLLRNYDRYSMANGLEIRMPFMDYRIVSFAFSLSWKSKIRDGYTKKIIRDMASPFVPIQIINRKSKIGFNSPMVEWARDEMKEFIIDTISSREFIECDLVNPLAAKVCAERVMDNQNPSFSDGENLWNAIMPYLWKKAVIDL